MKLAYFSYCDKNSLKNKYAASRRITEYAKIFDQVYVFCTDKRIHQDVSNTSNKSNSLDTFSKITYVCSPLPIYFFYSIYFVLKNLFKERRKISHIKIMEGFLGGLTGFLAAKILKAKLVCRFGARMKENAKFGINSKKNSLFSKINFFGLYSFLIIFESFIFKKCDRFVCNSKSIVPRSVKNCQVVYNGVDVDYFKPLAVDELKKKLGLNKDLLTIGIHGGISETKGIYYLVRALKSFEGKINFIFIGDGHLLNYCKKEIPWAIYTGFIPGKEISKYINCLDVEVLPTIKEGNDSFPNSLLEAMACEKVVIGTKMGGIPEMITDGEDGFLIEPNSTNEIIKIFNYMIKNKKQVNELRERAKKKIYKKFEINNQMKILCNLLFNKAN